MSAETPPGSGSVLPQGALDAGRPTAGQPDAGAAAGIQDAGESISPALDAGSNDAGPNSMGAGTPDAGAVGAGPTPDGGRTFPAFDGDVGCGSWTLENPLPQSSDLNAVWALAANDVWAAGQGGRLVHWNGSALQVVQSPTSKDLSTVWGVDANHVWAGGADLIRFDGTEWQTVPSPAPQGATFITGAAADDVWVDAGDVAVFHWDGAQWAQPGDPATRPTVLGAAFTSFGPLWAPGSGRAWVGGCDNPDIWSNQHALLWFWDGTGWTEINPGVPGCIRTIAGTAPNDVWATAVTLVPCGKVHCLGYQALHFDGVAWSAVMLDPSSPFFAPSHNEVWFYSGQGKDTVLARREAGAFRAFSSQPGAQLWKPIAAVSPTNWFSVGWGGGFIGSDGVNWWWLSGPTWDVYDMFGDASGAAWAVGGAVYRREAGRWSVVNLGAAGIDPLLNWNASFWSISGTNIDDVWLAGGDIAVHWDGTNFTQMVAPDGYAFFDDVWVTAQGRAFLASAQGLYAGDVVGLRRIADGGSSIWGSSETDIWLVRYVSTGSDIVHFDGATETTAVHEPWKATGQREVRGTAPDDVWAVAENVLLHFDGTSWSEAAPSAADVYSVAVGSRTDVWAQAADGIWQFDGTSWARPTDFPGGRPKFAGGDFYALGRLARICRH